ncbi:MAG: type I glyceraldehyde-3-phosphate dehydrogenase [bacterium]|nr:type I glyceraldehyde-3-phosphate dehydrogenase [bacterium]
MNLAINGFGRIGRNAFKIAWDKHKSDIKVVAINDITTPSVLAHLLKYDSNYGTWGPTVTADDKNIIVDGVKIPVYAEKEPNKLPWKDHDVDVVIESTGFFTNEAGMKLHLDAGAKKVVLSAPAKDGNIPTFVLGVNDESYAGQTMINNASCTTNCITPVAQVIHETFGVAKAMMTTIHSYTASQALQDGPKKDIREARAAAENIVPTTTGAAIATTQVIPELKGLFDGLSIRVPTPVVSLADFTFIVKKKTTVEEVNAAIKKACAEPRFEGIFAWTEEELVSSDFKGNSYSSIADLKLTKVIDGDMVKVIAWYDNEWGYSNRLVEQCVNVSK